MITNLFAGNEAYVEFHLSDFTDIHSIVVAIRSISNCSGVTNTSGGLRLVRTEIFNNANGDRSDVQNVIVLITDGNLARETDILDDDVRLVKSLDIRIVAVGITDKVSECAAIISFSFNDDDDDDNNTRTVFTVQSS